MKLRAMNFFYLLLSLISISCAAQPAENILSAKTPDEAKHIAESDLKKGTVSLFVQGGFAPVVNKGDAEFEKNYKVNISDFGCTALEQKIVAAYNNRIFIFLDSKYGRQWRDEVRQDIIGLKQYKQKQ